MGCPDWGVNSNNDFRTSTTNKSPLLRAILENMCMTLMHTTYLITRQISFIIMDNQR
jgi:hypothetical protein